MTFRKQIIDLINAQETNDVNGIISDLSYVMLATLIEYGQEDKTALRDEILTNIGRGFDILIERLKNADTQLQADQ